MTRHHQPEIERLTRQIVFMVPPSLFDRFEAKCRAQYKTVSEGLRELIVKYVLESE